VVVVATGSSGTTGGADELPWVIRSGNMTYLTE